jgi:hypothetical protein
MSMSDFDGIPDQGCIIDWGKPICSSCGGKRSPNSGKVCRKCYRENAAAKRNNTPDGIVLREMLDGERRGHFVLTPEGWTLPHFVKYIDWSKE